MTPLDLTVANRKCASTKNFIMTSEEAFSRKMPWVTNQFQYQIPLRDVLWEVFFAKTTVQGRHEQMRCKANAKDKSLPYISSQIAPSDEK